MNICVVSMMTGESWGGSELLWAEMVRAAIKDGHDVSVLTHPPAQEPSVFGELRGLGVSMFRRLPRIERRPIRLCERLVWPFPALLRKRPDVLCISQGSAFNIGYDPELVRFVETSGVPYVVVCQHAFDYRVARPDHRDIVSKFLKRANRVAFVAEKNWRSVERQLGCHLPNACVVRNPVNLDGPAMSAAPGPGPVRFACVARLVADTKGQDVLFEILGEDDWVARDWRLRLYGNGVDREWLETLAKYHGVDERVEFRGHVSDIRALWADNHLALFPSRSEGTPLALVEAMLCGRPSVVSDVGGNAEWVEEGHTGFIADAPTGRSFGAAMERAWAARDRWEEMGRDASHFASSSIDPDPGRTLLDMLVGVRSRTSFEGSSRLTANVTHS